MRITANDVRNIAENVQIEARALGLIDENTKIVYGAGSPTNGISATVEAVHVQENGHRNAVRVDFLPEFTYRQTAKDQYTVLDATYRALYAMKRHFG